MMDEKGIEAEVLGTVAHYEDFLKHIVWRDLIEVLKFRLERYRDDLCAAQNWEQVLTIQGAITELLYLWELPGGILWDLKQERKENG